MKKLPFYLILAILLTLSACSLIDQVKPPSQPTPLPPETVLAPQPPAKPSKPAPQVKGSCGDGVCDGPENANNCPSDCSGAALSPQPTRSAAPGSGSVEPGSDANTYWVVNPASNARLAVRVSHPQNWNGEALPTLVLVPGGTGTLSAGKVEPLAAQGFTVIAFDPDGRGGSQGSEDQDGYIQQDGLAAVIQATLTLPGVDPEKIGLVSYSYGITMASGALARYPDLPVKFLIDWEGPADRNDTTVGCKPGGSRQKWADCSDDAAWSQREALAFIGQIRVPYQRVQSEKDHVQPDVSNAIDMINAAVQGNVPWVRLNDYPPNQTYDIAYPPAMFADSEDKQLDQKIARYALELFDLVY